MLHDSTSVASALTDAARSINSHRSLDDTLDAIVRAAQQTVPGFEHVGISITHGSGRIETRAGTGRLVWDIDELQYKLGEGPCYDAITSGGITTMDDIATERRWPRYVEEAARFGLSAQMGLQLYNDESTLGGLNFYSVNPGIDPDAIQLAELFAAHASIALGRARHEHQLNESVTTRQAIGPEASAAVPKLLEMLTTGSAPGGMRELSYQAAYALGRIGPAAKPALQTFTSASLNRDHPRAAHNAALCFKP